MAKVAQLNCDSQTQLHLSAKPIPCGLHEPEYQRRHQSEAPTIRSTPGKDNPSVLLLLSLLSHLLCWCTWGARKTWPGSRSPFSKVTARVLSHWIRAEILSRTCTQDSFEQWVRGLFGGLHGASRALSWVKESQTSAPAARRLRPQDGKHGWHVHPTAQGCLATASDKLPTRWYNQSQPIKTFIYFLHFPFFIVSIISFCPDCP